MAARIVAAASSESAMVCRTVIVAAVGVIGVPAAVVALIAVTPAIAGARAAVADAFPAVSVSKSETDDTSSAIVAENPADAAPPTVILGSWL
jgi:hypothetical protein